MKLGIVVASWVGLPALALADGPQDGRADHDPAFVTLDRFDAVSRGGVDLGVVLPHDTGTTSVTLLRFEAHGQYIDPASGAGGYLQIPLTYLHESQGGTSDSTTAVGDLEIGGIYVPHLNDPGVGLVLHAGLTLPTASDSAAKELTNVYGSVVRLGDFYQIVPKGTSLRLGISPLLRSGKVFARFDLGVDANLSAAMNTTTRTVIRFQGGVGFDFGSGALMAESINLYESNSNASTGSSWINEGAVSVRGRVGTVQPYGAIVFPLDHDSDQIFDLAFLFGVEGLIR